MAIIDDGSVGLGIAANCFLVHDVEPKLPLVTSHAATAALGETRYQRDL